ncbi:transient receptor potential cation channel protein painless-like [Arctopsyche grandis]|uniref:transient receptor potential cation channel protein painless-like n=1 Tax=Arctopsyche grandis TaxID=121162 RepID=UPI00406D8235
MWYKSMARHIQYKLVNKSFEDSNVIKKSLLLESKFCPKQIVQPNLRYDDIHCYEQRNIHTNMFSSKSKKIDELDIFLNRQDQEHRAYQENSKRYLKTYWHLLRFQLLVGPQERLLQALRKKNLTEFHQLLHSKFVDVDYCYGYPDNKTCLEIACSECGNSKFVALLLNKNARLNKINPVHKKAAIHFAAETGDIEIMEELLSRHVEVNILSDGNTVLHLAIKKINSEYTETMIKFLGVIEELLKAGTDVNITDMKNKTALKSAAEGILEFVIKFIIIRSKYSIDFNLEDDEGQTAGSMIQKLFPHLMTSLRSKSISHDAVYFHQLLSHLNGNREKQFLNDFEEFKNTNEFRRLLSDEGYLYILVQYACDNGIDTVVSVLLKNGIDPNLTGPGNDAKSIAIACRNGFYKILNILLANGNTSVDAINGESLLQIALKGKYINKRHCSETNKRECIKILLKNDTIRSQINYTDDKQNTALHYAVKNGDQIIVLDLLRNGASINTMNVYNELPIADILSKTMKKFLDECLTTSDKNPDDENYEIKFNYTFLMPQHYKKENGRSEAEIKKEDKFLQTEWNGLTYMAGHSELKSLLTHPVITSFLYLKKKTMILVASFALYFTIGRINILSMNMAVFKNVSVNYVKFFFLHSIIITGFALSFYKLLHAVELEGEIEYEYYRIPISFFESTIKSIREFMNPPEEEEDDLHVQPDLYPHTVMSLIKTIIMSTGQFDASDMNFEMDPVKLNIFIMFVFMLIIILFNMLMGLVVNDIQTIRADANMVDILSQIRAISNMEKYYIHYISSRKHLNKSISKSSPWTYFIAIAKIGVKTNQSLKIVIHREESNSEYDYKDKDCELKLSMNIIEDADTILSKRSREEKEQSRYEKILENYKILSEIVQNQSKCDALSPKLTQQTKSIQSQ